MGPDDRAAFDVLIAIANFADDQGVMFGTSMRGLSALTRTTEAGLRRALVLLHREGWIFSFGSPDGSLVHFTVDQKKVARLAAVTELRPEQIEWVEQTLGIMRFPRRTAVLEAMRK